MGFRAWELVGKATVFKRNHFYWGFFPVASVFTKQKMHITYLNADTEMKCLNVGPHINHVCF